MYRHEFQGYFYADTTTKSGGTLALEDDHAEYEVWIEEDIEVRLKAMRIGPAVTWTRGDLSRVFGEENIYTQERAIAQKIIDLGGMETVFARDHNDA